MALILFKWLLITMLSSSAAPTHPIYISVTEIEHNDKDKALEVSCKLFTDDFEKTLRKNSTKKIDLLDPKKKNEMRVLVNNYIQQRFRILLDGKPVQLVFLDFEKNEEGIISYFQAENVVKPKAITVYNRLLYEFHSQQISLMHVTVSGNRKTTKLNNPEEMAKFTFE